MADSISTSKELLIENYFVDGDTRTQTIKNPRSTISSSDIQALQTYAQTERTAFSVIGALGSIFRIFLNSIEKPFIPLSNIYSTII